MQPTKPVHNNILHTSCTAFVPVHFLPVSQVFVNRWDMPGRPFSRTVVLWEAPGAGSPCGDAIFHTTFVSSNEFKHGLYLFPYGSFESHYLPSFPRIPCLTRVHVAVIAASCLHKGRQGMHFLWSLCQHYSLNHLSV